MKVDLRSSSLVRIVADEPHRSRVLSRHGIDHCAQQSLAAACRERGLDLELVLAELHAVDSQARACDRNEWRDWKPRALSRHLFGFHHAYVRNELPRLEDFVSRFAAEHPAHSPHMRQLRRVLSRLREVLHHHMMKEEWLVGPLLLRLASGPPSLGLLGPISRPLRELRADYDALSATLEDMRQLTNDYRPSPDASSREKMLYRFLGSLDRDCNQQVHEEKDILFPKILRALQSKRSSR